MAGILQVVATISTVLTLTAATLSVIGIVFTGFYPGIAVLVLLALFAICSMIFSKRGSGRPNAVRPIYYTALTVINLLLIPVVLWMAFVIVHDRVLQDCC